MNTTGQPKVPRVRTILQIFKIDYSVAKTPSSYSFTTDLPLCVKETVER